MKKQSALSSRTFNKFLAQYNSKDDEGKFLFGEDPSLRRERAIQWVLSTDYATEGKGGGFRAFNKYDFPIGIGEKVDTKSSEKALNVLVSSLLAYYAYQEEQDKKEEILKVAMKTASAKYKSYILEDYFDVALSAICSMPEIEKHKDIKKEAKTVMRYASNRHARILLLGRLFSLVLEKPKLVKALYENDSVAVAQKSKMAKWKDKRKKIEDSAYSSIKRDKRDAHRQEMLKKHEEKKPSKADTKASATNIEIYAPIKKKHRSLLNDLKEAKSYSEVLLASPTLNSVEKINLLNNGGNEPASKVQRLTTLVDEVKGILEDSSQNISERVESFNRQIQSMNLSYEDEMAVRISLSAQGLNFVNPKADPVAKELLLNSEQEKAMKTEGLALISAGAGAGKTRVLSAKIKYALKNENVSPYNIIATSFTRDSAQELRERVESALPGKTNISNTLIGRTTHSVATELINRFNPVAAMKEIIDTGSYEGKKFYSDAYERIKSGQERVLRKVETASFFDQEGSKIVDLPVAQKTLLSVINLVLQAGGRNKDMTFAKHDIRAILPLRDFVLKGKALPDTAFEEGSYETEGGIARLLRIADKSDKNRVTNALSRTLSKDEIPDYKKEMSTIIKAYTRWQKNNKKSSGNWWEIGIDLNSEKLDKKFKSLKSVKGLNQFITRAKANLLTPEQCYNNILENAGLEGSKISDLVDPVTGNIQAAKQVVFACAYKAYEVTLGEQDKRDHDDTIIETIRLLTNQKVLTSLKKQYPHIIVDEAQDLNPAQHMMFGLLAGTYAPNNTGNDRKPIKVESPTKDNGQYTLIGDTKQSIYGFRGSDPELFSHDADSERKVDLSVNYRSGSTIVNRMNAFVDVFLRDTETGAMCTPNFDKSTGSIRKVEGGTPEDGVTKFAEDIERALTDQYGNERYSDFGVAARTNAELIPYAFSLLEKGIPFSCSINPFNMKVTRDVINILRLSSSRENEKYWSIAYVQKLLGFNFVNDIEDLKSAFIKVKNSGFDVFETTNMTPIAKRIATEIPSLKQRVKDFVKYLEHIRAVVALSKDTTRRAELVDVILGSRTYTNSKGKFVYFERADGKKLAEYYSSDKQVLEAMQTADSTSDDSSEEEDIETSRNINFEPIVFLRKLLVEGVKSPGTYGREGDYDEGSSDTEIDTILDKITQMKEHAEDSYKTKVSTEVDAVILSTVHGWKGLETKHIYVPMGGDKFPNKREPQIDFMMDKIPNEGEATKRKEHEEARLAYVAVTRGKESANIITYRQKWTGGEYKDVEPSIFAESICTDPTEDD